MNLLDAFNVGNTIEQIPFIAENDTFGNREVRNEALLTKIRDVLLWCDYGARLMFVREIWYWHSYLEICGFVFTGLYLLVVFVEHHEKRVNCQRLAVLIANRYLIISYCFA
jgi:hypothetical protein